MGIVVFKALSLVEGEFIAEPSCPSGERNPLLVTELLIGDRRYYEDGPSGISRSSW